MAQLFVQLGKKVERVISLDVPKIIVGRSQSSDVVVPSEVVSRTHCQIIQEGSNFVVEDLNSSSGTFCNGMRVLRKILQNGDQIELGNYTLLFDGRAATTTMETAGEVVHDENRLEEFWTAGVEDPTPPHLG